VRDAADLRELLVENQVGGEIGGQMCIRDRTSGKYSGKVLFQSTNGLVAGQSSYQKGSVLFVNLPLGYLKGNTDGLMLRVPKVHAEAVYTSLRAWEQRTKITIEEQGYRLFARRDVNNYIAVSSNLDDQQMYDVKTKGSYNADAAKQSGRCLLYTSNNPCLPHFARHASLSFVLGKCRRH